MTERVNVVIAGGGPVGLTAAYLLGRAGREVIVLERDGVPNTDWRASTFHPPTLEMCEEMGIVDEMLRIGVVAKTSQMRDWRSGRKAEFDLTALADVTKYPFRLQLEQFKYSAILRDRIATLPNVAIRFGAEFEGFDTGTDQAPLLVALGVGVDDIACDWLIGCDGAKSSVRRQLGFGFEGITYPTRSLILSVDAPLDEWFPDICYVNYVLDSRESPGLVLRIPDLWRVSFALPDEVSDAEAVSDAYALRRLRGIMGDHEPPTPTSRSVYRVHQRVADKFRAGPVILLGDAAHVNSPRGGMGLNSGLHDAYSLASILLDTDRDAMSAALDEWAERRRDAATNDVQRISHRNTTEFNSGKESQVDSAMKRLMAIAADPEKAREWMLESSMLASVRRWYRPSAATAPMERVS